MSKRRAATDASNGVAAKKGAFGQDVCKGSWQTVGQDDLYIYTPNDLENRKIIAGFDIDGTIITTKSGKTFPTNESDWQLLFAEVPRKLKEAHENGYKLVFFTNQKGIQTKKVDLEKFKRKIEAVCSKIAAPVQVFVSPGTAKYRKPFVGMWERLEAEDNDRVQIDRARSIFVGDAAGRPAKGSKKKDFSCTDRLFAINIGTPFQTPEEYFLGKATESFDMPEFDPRKLFDNPKPLVEPSGTEWPANKQELVVMVGYPGSGKSTFAETAKNYTVVNRDTLRTWQKCVQSADAALKARKSVLVDNTNPDLESRKRYVDLAKKHKVACRCFVMNCELEQALHNVKYRVIMGTGKEHKSVNEIVLYTFRKNLKEPTTAEGFDSIARVNFRPTFKAGSSQESVYRMFLLEK